MCQLYNSPVYHQIMTTKVFFNILLRPLGISLEQKNLDLYEYSVYKIAAEYLSHTSIQACIKT